MDCKDEGQTDFRWDRKPHPMCIPHIVDGILGHLNVIDLKSCRLVSTQYNEIACKALQSEETIVFRSVGQLETYLENIKPISESVPSHRRWKQRLCSTSSLFSEDFLSGSGSEYSYDGDDQLKGSASENEWPLFATGEDEVEGARDASYKYSHRSFHFDCCDPAEEIEPFEYFFRHFGPQIYRLKYTTDLLPYNFPRSLGHMGEIWQDTLSHLEELVLEMKWGVPAYLFGTENADDADEEPRASCSKVLLPHLKRLHLDVLLSDMDADRAQLFFQQLLRVTPNVEEISIPESKRFFDDYINVILARVILATELKRLSVLNFCLALSNAQMRLLTDKGLPLTTLILDLEDLQFDGGQEEENLNAEQRDNNDPQMFPADAEEDEIRPGFPRQNRRPSFTPISKQTLQRFLNSVARTLASLHICFPQSPRNQLHTFRFLEEMPELRFLALGYFAGNSQILDQIPALKKLELWNVQFQDCVSHGKDVPDKYQRITSVIS